MSSSANTAITAEIRAEISTRPSLPHESDLDGGWNDMTRLRCRARALRSMADRVDPILAPSYRRRASELELEVWILEVRSGLDPDEPPVAA